MTEIGRSRGFDPEAILATLHRCGVDYLLIGGLAAALYGSPHVTVDVAITPRRDPDNLRRLAGALEELDARVRTAGVEGGLEFDRSVAMLSRVELLNLTTRFGDLDIAFVPAGTDGYEGLIENSMRIEVRGTPVVLAALTDIIRSKETAGRDKDLVTLPALRALLKARSERR